MSKATKTGDATKDKKEESPPAAIEVDELRRDIEDKRRELGDTAAELAAKADVKSQVKERVEERKEAVRDAGQRIQETATAQARRPDPRLIAGAVAGLILLLAVLKRRR